MVNKEGSPTEKGVRDLLSKGVQSQGWITRVFQPSTVESFDVPCVYPITENEIIFTEGQKAFVERRNIETDETVWKTALASVPRGIDYYPAEEKILVGGVDGIYHLDATTGDLVKTISSIEDTGGTTRDLAGARAYSPIFDPADPDYAYVPLAERDILYHFKLDTEVADREFGEWRNPGSDYAHLNNPQDVEANPIRDYVYVTDMFNNRVLRLKEDLSSVQDLMLVKRPRAIRIQRWGTTQQSITMMTLSSTPTGLGKNAYFFGWNASRGILFSLPLQMEWQRFNKDLDRMWGCHVWSAELDVRRIIGKYNARPGTNYLVNNETVDTGGWTSRPIPGIILGKIQVLTHSDQSGDLTIQVPNERTGKGSFPASQLAVPTDYSWLDYDTASISANTVNAYTFTRNPSLFRLKFVPDAQATVTLKLAHQAMRGSS